MRRVFIGLLLVFSFSAYTQNSRIEKDIERIPVNITEIQQYPISLNGDFFCFVRLIILEYGWEHLYYPIAVQWIFDDDDKKSHYIEYKKVVEETAMLSNSIVSVKFIKDSLQVELIGSDPIDFSENKYLLTIKPIGTYEIRKVP